jgi:phosphoglucosamine mutase
MGMDVYLLGPVPTPAVAMLTKSLRGDLGVMISASHNPYHDNGIKLFDAEGRKLSDEVEAAIEKLLKSNLTKHKAASDKLGRVKRLDDAAGRYVEFVKATFPKGLTLAGLKVVIDCANGAAYRLAPTILWELGAEVISVGVEPNGFNINEKRGSTHPEYLQKKVLKHETHIGIALDGDADRLIVCDEKGVLVDGDQLLALIATEWKKRKLLSGDGIVATVMSNMGLEQYLEKKKLKLHRANVGDRYVVEGMQKHGCNVGGEQSGHIIFSDFSTTGDGMVAALQVLASLVKSGKKASQCLNLFKPLPQILKNVRLKSQAEISKIMESAALKKAIQAQEKILQGRGRILVRKSGTEPLIRIMVEGESLNQIEQIAGAIAVVIEI